MRGGRDVGIELFESCAEAVLYLDPNGILADQNMAARDLLAHDVGAAIRAEPIARGRARVGHANGAEVIVDAKSIDLTDGGQLLLLSAPLSRFARGAEQMGEVVLTEQDPSRILSSLAEVAGQTLEVDRALIYEVRFATQEAEALCEWLNPEVDVSPTKATYPLSAFAGGDAEMRRTKSFLESHADARHEAFVSDGSAEVLHGHMAIKSLLWCPFDFRENGYYALVFNQVARRREWLPPEREFLRVATRQVTLALRQVAWMHERARTERTMLETQKLESIRLLAGGVAHDLGGHLGIVLGSIDRARAASASADHVASSLHNAECAALEASSLAKHLLAYSGKGQFVIEPVDLGRLIDEMGSLLHVAAGGVPVRLEVSTTPIYIQADRTQLKQVVMNLVRNAAEATRADGQVTIAVHAPEPTSAVLEVRDNGIGMAPHLQKQILEPFFSTKGEGRGLGLAAVAGIVRAHRGELLIQSEPARGSVFTLSFPRIDEPAHKSSLPPSASDNLPLVGTVLLADDLASLRRSTAMLLDTLGLTVIEVADGDAAVSALAAHPDISVLLLDWTMQPGGDETMRRVRAARPDLPIVVMSGYTTEAVRLQLDGRMTFLEKPFRLDELESALRRVRRRQPV